MLALERSQLALAYLFGSLASGCIIPYAGRLIDRLGTRIMTLSASLLLAVVLLIMIRSIILFIGVAMFRWRRQQWQLLSSVLVFSGCVLPARGY